jgi:uncharacterized SAM-binding protein YcdF (DUF218 family)
MKRKFKFVVAAAICLAAWTLLAPYFARYLMIEKPLDTADAIIVLSGSAVYKERTRKAAEIYQQGVAPLIVITNDGGRSGWSRSEQRNLPYVELEQRELIAHGVLPDAIVTLPGVVSGTDDEARAIAVEIEPRQIRSLIIVTSAYHTRRALNTFEKILAGKNVEIGVVHAVAGEDAFDPNYWWLSILGWQTVAGEYVKSVVYYLYY